MELESRISGTETEIMDLLEFLYPFMQVALILDIILLTNEHKMPNQGHDPFRLTRLVVDNVD